MTVQLIVLVLLLQLQEITKATDPGMFSCTYHVKQQAKHHIVAINRAINTLWSLCIWYIYFITVCHGEFNNELLLEVYIIPSVSYNYSSYITYYY